MTQTNIEDWGTITSNYTVGEFLSMTKARLFFLRFNCAMGEDIPNIDDWVPGE